MSKKKHHQRGDNKSVINLPNLLAIESPVKLSAPTAVQRAQKSRSARVAAGHKQLHVVLTLAASDAICKLMHEGETMTGLINRLLVETAKDHGPFGQV